MTESPNVNHIIFFRLVIGYSVIGDDLFIGVWLFIADFTSLPVPG